MKLGTVIFMLRLIAAAIILLLIDFEKLIIILRSLNIDLIVLAFSLELAGFLIWTLKWKFFVDKLKKIKFTTLFLVLMAGNCLSTNVLRARTFGGFGRAKFLGTFDRGHKQANWYATIAMDQTGNNFVFTFLAIFSMLFVFLFLDIPWWLSIIMETIALLFFLSAFAAYISSRKIEKKTVIRSFYSNLHRIYNFSAIKFIRNRFDSYNKFEEMVVSGLTEFADTYRSILKDRRTMVRDLGLSVIMYAFIYSKAYVLFQSVGYDISILHLIVSFSLMLWINSIIPVPYGFGLKEIVMIGIYTMVGVPINIAAIVSFIDRAIYLFFVIIISYSAIVFMRIFHIGKR